MPDVVTSVPDSTEPIIQSFRDAVVRMHVTSRAEPIRLPSANGAFPADILLRPPPVVVDANRLRNDILRACRKDERTVLVNAANGGLIRLFCASHVIDEVAKHSGEWTAGGPVSRQEFLAKWLTDYLPLIRVVLPNEGQLALLSPEEFQRIQVLSSQDADDVPSATLALLLQAFYLSNDRRALRAVYGDEVDLAAHDEWVNILKAGGDAGELGKMFTLVANLTGLLGAGLVGGVKRIVGATTPWILLPVGAWAIWKLVTASTEAKERMKSAGQSALIYIAGALFAYEEVRTSFARVAPKVPSWESLAETNPPDTVLARACLHTLARSLDSNRSAEALADDLPYLPVAQGEAKIRSVLRSMDCFTEVWRGRWQVGDITPALRRYLERVSPRPGE